MSAETSVALDADVIATSADCAVGNVVAEEASALESGVAIIADFTDNVADGSTAGDAVGDVTISSLAES